MLTSKIENKGVSQSAKHRRYNVDSTSIFEVSTSSRRPNKVESANQNDVETMSKQRWNHDVDSTLQFQRPNNVEITSTIVATTIQPILRYFEVESTSSAHWADDIKKFRSLIRVGLPYFETTKLKKRRWHRIKTNTRAPPFSDF